jgi:FkbM family methyltransferase
MYSKVKNIYRLLRRAVKVLLRRDLFITADSYYKNVRLGSEYGGWNIIAEHINKNSIVYSFGVGEDISFDLALINKFGVKVHAFDPTPRSIKWVKDQNLDCSFVMHEYGLLNYDGLVAFFEPKNSKYISHTIVAGSQKNTSSFDVIVKKLQTILKDLQHDSIDLLKMDIEGSEYSVIKDMESTNIRPKQLLIEFHHRFQGIGAKETRSALQIIRKMGYKLFYVSKSGEEFSFVLE